MKSPIHELFDKRVQKPLVYQVENLGEDVTIQEILTYKIGKCHLRFNKPNTTSIFLSSSAKSLTKAKAIYNQLILPKLTKRQRFDLTDEESISLYDYLEYIQAAVVMAFTAVECLVNELIPSEFIFHEKLKNGEIKMWDSKEIERWMSTTDKIALVIPTILNITNPKTYNFWPKFAKLKDLRNDIIHSKNVLPIDQEENERIFSLLLNESVFGKIKSASELINKIHSEIPPHKAMPILKEKEIINSIKIPTWEDLGAKRVD